MISEQANSTIDPNVLTNFNKTSWAQEILPARFTNCVLPAEEYGFPPASRHATSKYINMTE